MLRSVAVCAQVRRRSVCATLLVAAVLIRLTTLRFLIRSHLQAAGGGIYCEASISASTGIVDPPAKIARTVTTTPCGTSVPVAETTCEDDTSPGFSAGDLEPLVDFTSSEGDSAPSSPAPSPPAAAWSSIPVSAAVETSGWQQPQSEPGEAACFVTMAKGKKKMGTVRTSSCDCFPAPPCRRSCGRGVLADPCAATVNRRAASSRAAALSAGRLAGSLRGRVLARPYPARSRCASDWPMALTPATAVRIFRANPATFSSRLATSRSGEETPS